jgi:hypothetical protein
MDCSRERDRLRLAQKRLELQQEGLGLDREMFEAEKKNFKKNAKLSSKKAIIIQDKYINGGVSRIAAIPENGIEDDHEHHNNDERLNLQIQKLEKDLKKIKLEYSAATKKHSEEKTKWENIILDIVPMAAPIPTTTVTTPSNMVVNCSIDDEEVKRLNELLEKLEKENETLREEKYDLKQRSSVSLMQENVTKEFNALREEESQQEKETLEIQIRQQSQQIDDLNLLLPRNKVLLEQTQLKNEQLNLQLENIRSHNRKQADSTIKLEQKLELQRQQQQQQMQQEYDDDLKVQEQLETITLDCDDTHTGISSSTERNTTESLNDNMIIIPLDYSSQDLSALEKKFVIEWEWTNDHHQNGLGGHYTGWLDTVGNPDGYGTLRISDGSVYTGKWEKGLRTGNGVYATVNGDLFSGLWLNDKFEGRGVYASESDQIYTGDFQDGLKHGSGIETWVDGARYVGQYQHDKRNGRLFVV